MNRTMTMPVLAEIAGRDDGAMRLTRQAMFVALGIAALTIAANVRLWVPPSPVPVNMATFVVLAIGASYGPRLGVVTLLGWLGLGALGADVFTSSSAESSGLSYMTGATGGYLLGYVLAAFVLGRLAQRGWDRSVGWMALAMLIGNALIYLPGVAWINQVISNGAFDPTAYASVWDQTLAWGLTPYLIGDAMKLALAAVLLPTLWKLVGSSRT